MPKVLSILNRTNIGGPIIIAGLQAYYLAPEFETLLVSGHPTINERNAEKEIQQFNLNPYYLPEMGRELSLINDYRTYRKIKAIIKDFKPDIVHTHAAKPGTVGRLAAAAMNVPIILHTFHGHVFHSYFSSIKTKFFILLERMLAKLSTRIIAISPRQKHELSSVYKIAPANKIEMIPIGLFMQPFLTDQQNKRRVFRKEFGIDDGTIVISITGRIVHIKNHPLFIRALLFLRTENSKPFKAFIVGDGERRAAIEAECLNAGLTYSTPEDTDYSRQVIFTSWRNDIDFINAGSDIVALTSLNEGTPISIIEAQASGKPVVATDCGGMLDVVLNNETALVAPQGDEVAFNNHLFKLVNDDNLRGRLGKNSSQWMQKKYGHERLIEDMRELYSRLLFENSEKQKR